MNKSFIFCYLFLLTHFTGVSQVVYKKENLKFTNGLPSDIVLCTTKKDGKLYVATQRGLCQYDGYRFIKSPKTFGLTNSLFAKKDNVYFYSSGIGLCSIRTVFDNPQVISRVNYNDSIPNNDHYDNLYVDRFKRIWCSDQNSIKYFKDSEKRSFKTGNHNKEITQNISFLEPNLSELWIATAKGVLVYNSQSKKIQKHSNPELANANIVSATVIGSFSYFTTIDGDLLVYNALKKKLFKESVVKYPKSPLHLVRDSTAESNAIFLYAENEVFKYNTVTKTKTIFYRASSSTINHVFYDAELHLFWISTSKGLVKLSKINDNIITLDIPNPKTVVSIVQDSKQNIWCVTKTNELFCYTKNKHWNTYLSPDSSTKFQQLSLKKDSLYLAANDGIYTLINGGLKKQILSKITIKKVIVDQQNLLWALPISGPIKVYDGLNFKEKKKYLLNSNSYWNENTFNDIAVSPTGKIWLASWMPKGYGISYYDEKKHQFIQIDNLTEYKNNTKFVTDYFNRIAFTKDNQILFSGYGGWNIVSPKGEIIKSLNTDLYQVANDHIEGISKDTNGNIWFACAEGLNQYNYKTDKVVRVSSIDGLASNDITNGYYALQNNQLILGTDAGIQLVDLNKITKTQLINALELTAAIKDGSYLHPKNNTLVINYDYTELDLLFSALSFSEKEKIIYRYQFKGEKKWNYLGAIPKLSLIKLSPGAYTITIQAGDNLGNWQPKSLELKLQITSPFYYRWWFLALLFLVVATIGFFINHYLVQQEKIKGILKRKIKDMEMQTLRSQMNPHFIFNTMNSINSYIIQNQKEIASDYLTRFSKLMRNILDLSKQEFVALNKEIETLCLYLELEALRLENKFDYSIVIDQDIDQENTPIPPLIIQPFVENAIWHGIHNKKTQGTICIAIKNISKNQIEITIEDDGIGRKAAGLLKTQQVNHKSYGIDITMNRLQLLDIKNKVSIIDLYDHNHIACGTQISIVITVE
jgi:ligand-binding sensor domain-containing protein